MKPKIKGAFLSDIYIGQGCLKCNNRGYTISTYHDEVRDENTYWSCPYCMTEEQKKQYRDSTNQGRIEQLESQRQSAQRRMYLFAKEEEEYDRRRSNARAQKQEVIQEIKALDKEIEELRGR